MEEQKKHLVFIISFLDNPGGTERVVTLLANYLSQYYKLTIISRKGKESYYPLDSKVQWVEVEGGFFKFSSNIQKFIKNNNPDVVVMHTMSRLTPFLLLLGIKAKQLWSVEHTSFQFHSQLYKLARKILYRKLDKIITLTESDGDNYTNSITIQNPASFEVAIYQEKSAKIALSIGTLMWQKGYDLLLEAWSLVETKNSDWELHIYGMGEDEEALLDQKKRLRLSNVHFKGLEKDIQPVYQNAGFYVMSSRNEGLPMTLLEAQSQGLPMVSFDCPTGPSDIIKDGKNGYLVDCEDTRVLADKMNLLIENDNLREHFSKNSLLMAKKFSIEETIEKWMQLIN